MSFTVHARTGQRLPATGPSLLAACIAMALLPSAAFAAETAAADETMIVEGNGLSTSDSQDQDYSVKTTTTGTKLLLVPRDIPQSVSVISKQRMADQNLTNLRDVLNNTTGINVSRIDSSRTNIYSRGFFVSNYAYEDLPTTISSIWNFGDTVADTAIYDSIEVVRGAAGLMSVTGNPSAYVNMVRKHADSKEFKGDVTAEYGSWDKQRYVLDLQAPLTESGNVRGRVVAGYQDNDSWLDRYHNRRKFLYGIVDADLSDATTISLGYDYSESSEKGASWGGLPTWYSNGNRTHFDRGTNTAPDWAYSDQDSTKVFTNLVHRFNNGWEARVNAMHTETNFDSKLMYAEGTPDEADGTGMVVSPGWNTGKRKQDSIDAFTRGGFDLFGRQHELVVGGSFSQQKNTYYSTYLDKYSVTNTVANSGMASVAEPNWNPWALASPEDVRQASAYASARFSLADPLHLILGSRYTQWNAKYAATSASSDTLYIEKRNVTPYAGLVYDINDTWSAYASYTSIFQPVQNRDANGRYLDPTTGESYEAGVKADWFNTRLTTSVAIFRIEQDNLPVQDTFVSPVTGQKGYHSEDGTVSKGIEFEVNGALTDNWQMTFGATRYIAENQNGEALQPRQARTTAKLFTRYQLPALPELAVGGGVNWQGKVWDDSAKGPNGDRAEQGSYALFNLFSRYEVTKNFAVQANVNNLFNKEHYGYVGSYLVYGEPRNFSVSANYKF